jgi:thiosulfate dehydrogenase [quinone] large subunit
MTSIGRDRVVGDSDWFGRSLAAAAPGAWLLARLVLGVEFFRAGVEKLGAAGWTAAPVGAAVKGFLQGALDKAAAGGQHAEVGAWFASLTRGIFLPHVQLFAYLVTYGELLVGIALILGLFTRVSLVFGVIMNLSFLFAGTTSTNPQMVILAVVLLFLGSGGAALAVDLWILPALADAVGSGVTRIWQRTVIVIGAATGMALICITTGVLTWLAAAVVAAAVSIAASRLGPREASGTPAAGTTR